MPVFAPQAVKLKCPNCGTEIVAHAFSIVDAQSMPAVKGALLSGQLNTFTCPKCGLTGMLNVPLFYHDTEKELALVYLPAELDLAEPQRQQIIGEMTRAVMNALPAEKRKGYLLQPRQFLTLTNFMDTILEAEGIDKALLEERRQKGALVDRLVAVMDDPVAFKILVEDKKSLIDEEFYGMLRYSIDIAAAEGHKDVAGQLSRLYERLLPVTEAGRKIQAYQEAVEFLNQQPGRGQVLEKVLSVQTDVQLEALVRVLRPLLDYIFFQHLANRIRQAEQDGNAEEARRLESLRDRILAITDQVDRETTEAVNQAASVLRSILAAPDLEKAVEENLDQVNDLFLFVLSSQLKEAQQRGLKELAERLAQVWSIISRRLQPEVPPEIALIEEVLSLRYPEETRTFLETHKEEVTPQVLDIMEALAKDMEAHGREDVARRLREVRAQALAMA